MIDTNFSISQTVKSSPQEVFKAITAAIPDWWSRQFTGAAVESGQIFTVAFDTHHSTFKKMRTGKILPHQLVEWECIDAHINIDELNNKKEWIDTKMVWEIKPVEGGSMITLTHEGLTPELDCYAICDTGWNMFVASLVQYLETGKGKPFE